MPGLHITRALLLLTLSACTLGVSHGNRHPHVRARDLEGARVERLPNRDFFFRDVSPDEISNDQQISKKSLPGFMPDDGTPRTRNSILKREYAEKLAIRDDLIQKLSQGVPRIIARQTSTSSDLESENNELEQGLDNLSSAIDSVFDILAKYYPACLGSNYTSSDSDDPDSTTTIAETEFTTTPTYVTNYVGSTGPITPTTTSPSIAGTYAITSAPYPIPSNGTSLNTTSAISSSSVLGTTTNVTTSSNSTSYTFKPMASTNVAVYYGQSDITSEVRLDTICEDPSVDIVILAFITDLDSGNGYPTLNLGGSGCYAATAAQTAAGATGLIDCTEKVSPQIETCQSIGKPVMLSFGGAEGYSETTIPNATAAEEYAGTLWKLFGQGTGLESIRPFGNVSLDGFDIDNEYPSDDNYPTFISSLRSYISTATKPMYLSAAPQCPRPSESIPLSSMQTALDFVFVQFYNNPSCDINTGTSFLSSVAAWSSDLVANSSSSAFDAIDNGVTSPRLFVGAVSWSGGSESSYVNASALAPIFADVRALDLPNLGGGMLWNAEYGEENTDADGASFVSVFKADLEGSTG